MSKVLVSLITMEHIRKADFLPYFLGLEKPVGALMTTIHGQSPARGRNIAIEQALQNDCTHVFFMDDDMAMPPDTLTKLLAHDKDIVTGLYLMRTYPHFPVLFDEAFDDGKCKFLFLEGHLKGLIPVVNCGFGCVLVKTDVLRKMERPWVTLGEIEKDGWCDDVSFFNRARKAGAEIFADLDAPCGHMTSNTLWPSNVNGKWFTEYKNEGGNVVFPQTIPPPE